MTLGDRIAVLHEGRLQQCAPPLDVYRTPATAFVAGFVGSPAMNFLECTLSRDGDRLEIFLPQSLDKSHNHALVFQITQSPNLSFNHPITQSPNHQILLGMRPEDIEIVGQEDADAVGRVDVVERLGSEMVVHVDLGGTDFRVLASAESPVREDESIGLRMRRDRVHLFEPASGTRIG